MKDHDRRAARNSAERTAKKHVKTILILLVIVILIAAILLGYWYFFLRKQPSTEQPSVEQPSTGEPSTEQPSPGQPSEEPSGGESAPFSIHFLELGNKYAGDCVLVKAGDAEVLIDGGSREASAETIEEYVDRYCTDGILEYVIVTHADQDHIAAFAGNGTHKSLFERYECKVIVDFPRTDKKTKVYERYVASRDAEVKAGATHYTALECYRNENGAQRSYELAEGVTMNFLYNYYYENPSSDENNYSVCLYFRYGDYHYLFTGDLEEKGEEYLVEYNTLPQCKLYKAGHHGSKTSSTEKLLSVIRPEIVCVCCCAGSPEYTSDPDNVFPTRAMLRRVEKYTDRIYVTSLAINVDLASKKWDFESLNGNIVVTTTGKEVTVTGSENSLTLRETEWYRQNRA